MVQKSREFTLSGVQVALLLPAFLQKSLFSARIDAPWCRNKHAAQSENLQTNTGNILETGIKED